MTVVPTVHKAVLEVPKQSVTSKDNVLDHVEEIEDNDKGADDDENVVADTDEDINDADEYVDLDD
ncbi:hypothetical protein C6P40_005362, partial [Pichia californica]